MALYDASSRDLTFALVGSLIAHGALVATLAGTHLPKPIEADAVLVAFDPDAAEPDEIDPLDPPEETIRPGIADATSDSPNWLGFNEATPHEAPESVTEQPALTLEQPGGGEPAAPDATSAATVAAEPADPVPPAPPSVPDPQPAADESALDSAPAAPDVSQEQAAVPTPEAQPARIPVPKVGTGHGDMTGLQSDKESVATALKNATSIRPGQTLAGKGLDIKTRQPRWHTTTRFISVPRNPVVRVTFGRDGRVKRAVFLADEKTIYSTGAADVDEPLLQAIYRWTASGEDLGKLPADDPRAGITMTFRIILVGA